MTTRRFAAVLLAAGLVTASSWGHDQSVLMAQAAKPEAPAKPASEAKPAPKARPAAASAWPKRTPDGQPDIQGIWANAETGTFTMSLEPLAHVMSLGGARLGMMTTSSAGSGLRVRGKRTTPIVDPPDGRLPYQPWAAERRLSVAKNFTRPEKWQVDTQTLGWPEAVPRSHVYSSADGDVGGPWQVLQGPGYVLFLYETQHEFRYVPLDGRAQPGSDVKLWMGSSRGHWEGNTLVIETANINDSSRLSIIGDFHSDAMRVTERFTFVDQNTLEYRATVDDPKVFTRPWTISLTNTRSTHATELMEYSGVEGEAAVTKWLPQ